VQIAEVPHVVSVASPYDAKNQISKDGTIAVASVAFDEQPLDMGKQPYNDVKASVSAATKARVQVEFGGEVAQFGEAVELPGLRGPGPVGRDRDPDHRVRVGDRNGPLRSEPRCSD